MASGFSCSSVGWGSAEVPTPVRTQREAAVLSLFLRPWGRGPAQATEAGCSHVGVADGGGAYSGPPRLVCGSPARHSAGQLWIVPPPPPACNCESHLRGRLAGVGCLWRPPHSPLLLRFSPLTVLVPGITPAPEVGSLFRGWAGPFPRSAASPTR